ncbi:STAS domain-containing protein [Streptomyces heilongjiangensis]|uniref:STAS domain-containing protein n=1 Tax=Streptomyces heilongjiangensis TaxID=945052 RepID=A0ABW1BKC8_9ACTN|nr:STAS domain-containing protein [Streptomyces heilongjiangensis]MDC2952317.1 STAS domain-containing protein [Streptomyces heilongjiangensis]
MTPPQPNPEHETTAAKPMSSGAPHHHGEDLPEVGSSRLSIQPITGGQSPPVLELHLAGELDIDTSTSLREYLAALAARSPGGLLVLNLSGITFCDSAGLYTLLGIRQALSVAGIEVQVAELSAATRAAAERAGPPVLRRVLDAPGPVPPDRRRFS